MPQKKVLYPLRRARRSMPPMYNRNMHPLAPKAAPISVQNLSHHRTSRAPPIKYPRHKTTNNQEGKNNVPPVLFTDSLIGKCVYPGWFGGLLASRRHPSSFLLLQRRVSGNWKGIV